MEKWRKAHTLAGQISYSGVGIHTGQKVNLTFCPASVGTGIVFKRVDLPEKPLIPARVDQVVDTNRSTTIAAGGVKIHTVEHVLAALHAYQIDNLIIELSNFEPPVANGGSDAFVKIIEEVGIVAQESSMPIAQLETPVFHTNGEIQVVALPADEFRISYTLSYPESKLLGAQFFSVEVTPEQFREEIAPCRTFAKNEEIAHLQSQGLIQGGSLENAVLIQDDQVVNEEGLLFPNEMARHKILDMIGDLSLVGMPFHAHVIAIKSGHTTNAAFAKVLQAALIQQQEVAPYG